jgi:ubiquitin C-terminal hydrolase
MSCLCKFAVLLSALGLASVLGYLMWVTYGLEDHKAPLTVAPVRVGFTNNGNTCYQNALLQNLVRLPQMEAWARANQRDPHFDVSASLSQLWFDVNMVQRTPVNPSYVRDALSAGSATRWNNGETQDSQDFYMALMTSLEDSDVLSTARFSRTDRATCVECGRDYSALGSNVVLIADFDGTDELNLQTYLRDLTSQATEQCPLCQNAEGRAITIIDPMPEILAVHFTRINADGGERLLDNTVAFPLERMQLNGRFYNLSGMVDYQGTRSAGHYVATVKNHTDGVWFHYDDETVTEVPSSAVITTQSYVAFFIAA